MIDQPSPSPRGTPAPEPEIRLARTHAEYLAALRVRVQVFVEEQGGPLADEPDEWDTAARHFVVLEDGAVVGTARIFFPSFGVAKVGRVALLAEYRGRGWGALLLGEVVDYARTLAVRELFLDAQVSAAAFYSRFGFMPEGEEFLEAGLIHRRMRLVSPR